MTPLYIQSLVEVDGSLITSQGPGTTFQFALQLVKTLVGEEEVKFVVAIVKPIIFLGDHKFYKSRQSIFHPFMILYSLV